MTTQAPTDRDNGQRATGAGRGTALILVARVFQLVSGFGVSVVLARGLGPVEFGVYGVVMSLLTWMERIINAGVPGATTTLVARMPEQRATVEQSARFLMVLWALPLFGVGWALAPTIAARFDIPSGAALIRIALLNLPAMALFFGYDSIYLGRRLFGLQSLLLIIQSAAKLVGVLLLFFIGLSVAGAFVVHVAATILTMLLVGLRYRIGDGRPSAQVARQLVATALPMGVYSVAFAVLMNLSLWQLQSSSGQPPEQVGYFVAVNNLTRIMMMVPASVSGVLYASLTWAITASQPQLVTKYVQGAARFALIVMVPACALLAANATGVMELLYGRAYAPGGRVLTLQCIAYSMIAVFDVLCFALMAAGRLVIAAALLLGMIPVLYVLNVLWIDSSGAIGAASASAVTFGVGTVVVFALTKFFLAAPLRPATAGRVLGSGFAIGMASLVIHTSGAWLIGELAALGVAYLALLLVTGEVSIDEARHFALWKPERR